MEAGRVIGGKYRLRREIGKGAMGSVWAAVHESLGRTVAVKFLRPTGVNPDTAAARFVAEARMAAAVKHRFVVDIFDFGITEEGTSYMVLDLLEGEELGERMYYGPPMLVSEAVRFVCQCLSGLEAVHDAGIVHRDLKPENIFIIADADGAFPTLLDFGISKMNEVEMTTSISLRPPRMGGGRPVQLTMPGTVIGTPWYMAPEQLRGLSSIDARADIFGMGIILWEWLVGRVPYDDDNIGDLLMNVIKHGPPDLMHVRPDLGPELARALQTAMATKREERFQTAREMREALHPLVGKLPQAWTVVQKSIADMSSAEVLGVRFPSEAPTHRLTGAFSKEEVTSVDELAALAQVEVSRPANAPATRLRTPTPEPYAPAAALALPVPPPAAGARVGGAGRAMAWVGRTWAMTAELRARVAVAIARLRPLWVKLEPKVRPWLERTVALAALVRARTPLRMTSLGAVGLSLLLLLVVAIMAGRERPPELPPTSDVLLTSAAAQPVVVSARAEVTHAPKGSDAANASVTPPAQDPEAGDLLPSALLAPDTVSTTAAGGEADATDSAAEIDARGAQKPAKKRPLRPKRKKKRLFRSLDF